MHFNLLTKMLVFAAIIAALPLLVSGQSLIRIAQDELKSTANEQLVTTAQQITDEFNDFYEFGLFSTLNLIRNSIDGDKLNFDEKIDVLKQGLIELPDIVALQVDVQGAPAPIVISQQRYVEELSKTFDDPLAILNVDTSGVLLDAIIDRDQARVSQISYIEEMDDWIATSSLPLKNGFLGREATLHAQINLQKLREIVANHPFALTGNIHVVDGDENILFSSNDKKFENANMLKEAITLLESGSGALSVKPYELKNKKISLGAMSFTRPFPWAVLVQKSEEDAYLPVTRMISSLGLWLSLGLLAALIGAILFSLRISRPIMKISDAAIKVAGGDLDFKVENINSRDEIGTLAARFNDMIVQLSERLELQKFVSHGTMKAISTSNDSKVSLGGGREKVSILFADIRGYTAFSETREPEEVVSVLNHYFQKLGDIVTKHNGDIDKYVGDQIMAVFHDDKMGENSVRCALEIMKAMDLSKEQLPNSGLEIGIGLDMGAVVVGAMGSRDRMDYTVLGDHVNLAARLCSKADARQTLISKAVYEDLPNKLQSKFKDLPSIKVKGKTKKIVIFGFNN
ncbi:MAG: adenylate/guanylate cyclase domain-containing protein [Nitratireductor sp.]